MHTCFNDTISPVLFLNFLSCLKKYQKRDLATMRSGAKILILYKGVVFSFSVGNLRPITSYSFNYEKIYYKIKALSNTYYYSITIVTPHDLNMTYN